MKLARSIVLVIAGGAGLFAWNLASNLTPPPVQETAAPTTVEPQIKVHEVLVARHDIPIGAKLDATSMEWQEWPASSMSSAFITRDSQPDASDDLIDAIATAPIYVGEPIKENILARAGRGFMSAILPSGRRAISIKVETEFRAAGFILPNDRIDVILSRVERGSRDGRDQFRSETILQNVRVLAIDQTFEERDGEKYVTGEIATLELSPREAELLALANQMGDLSLSLRSVADADVADTNDEEELARRLRGRGESGGVQVIKFGIQSGSGR